MNRRDFLKGLSAIVPASLLRRFLPETVDATTFNHETTYHTDDINEGEWFKNGGRIQSESEKEFKSFGGYFAYQPSRDVAGKWDVIDLSQDE